ncbi:MAG: DnaD domain protein [Halanaerobiales bacterium]
MTDNLFIKQQQKTAISTNKCKRSIEIGNCAIDQGFLLQFPGATLSIFLYLITHANERDIIETNPTIISSYIHDTYGVNDIKDSLIFLEKHDIIEFSRKRDGDYTYQIKIKLHNLSKNLRNQKEIDSDQKDFNPEEKDYRSETDFRDADRQESNTDISSQKQESYIEKGNNENRSTNKKSKVTHTENNNNHIYYDQREIRENILAISQPSRSELFQAILTFVPPSENIGILENNINQWLEDFDSDMIKELIRRVNKWLEKYNNPPEKALHYLKGIIDDWYQKDLKDYEDLKYHDKLYREVRDIARIYGLDQWQNIKPVHMETFSRWLNEGFSLSSQIVKLAINQAIRRKKDGQPSLKYIEDNFINPMKKRKVRNPDQALQLLEENNLSKYNQTYVNKNTAKKSHPCLKKSSATVKKTGVEKSGKKSGNSNWDDLIWDFEE